VRVSCFRNFECDLYSTFCRFLQSIDTAPTGSNGPGRHSSVVSLFGDGRDSTEFRRLQNSFKASLHSSPYQTAAIFHDVDHRTCSSHGESPFSHALLSIPDQLLSRLALTISILVPSESTQILKHISFKGKATIFGIDTIGYCGFL
jgi:hypothetical protein